MQLIANLPHSHDFEMIILGCAIAQDEHLRIVSANLEKEDFYFIEHQIIFTALRHLEGHSVDTHLLCEYLKREKLLSKVKGVHYIVQLVQFAGTSAHIEEYINEVKRLSLLRKIVIYCKMIETRALQGKEHPKILLEEIRNLFGKQQERCLESCAFSPIAEMIKKEEAFLDAHKGKKYLGIQTSFIEEFNESFLGLRGLNILAAAPNSGKTALAVQLGIDAAMTNADVCLVFVSLEMSSEEIFRRMFLLLTEMDYRTFVFGPWEETDQEAVARAKTTLSTFHERIQILEASTNPAIDAGVIADYVDRLKSKTGCQRAVVIIDYLQVWPANASMRYSSENELDKWRIGEMKKLKEFLSPDPIIVISEARKPNMKESTWGGSLADVMGSARTTYTPDVVMLLTPLAGNQLQTLWEENKMPAIKKIEAFLERHGISLCQLEVPKARDGMRKFNLLLEFHFRKNKFKKLDLDWIRSNIDFSTRSTALKKNNQSFADLFLET